MLWNLEQWRLREIWKAGSQQHPLRGGAAGYCHNHRLQGSQAGVQLGSEPHWLCDLGQLMDLSGLPLFDLHEKREERVNVCEGPGTLWMLIKCQFPFLSGPLGRLRGSV